jgi:hypothetical protein
MRSLLLLLVAFPAFGYTVGGNIFGLDTYLVLRLNNQYTYIAPPYATSYQFSDSLVSGTNYAVTVGIQPGGMKCTVKNWLASSVVNVTNVDIICVKMATATVNWTLPTQNTDGSPLTDLIGYVIYYGTDPTLTASNVRIIPNGSVLSTTFYSLPTNNKYYFAIASVATSGIGPRSNIASVAK